MRKLRPKDLERLMKGLGVRMESVDAVEVQIKLGDGSRLRISDPQVTVTKMGDMEIFQVIGRVERLEEGEEGEAEVYEPSPEDVKLVASQAGVDEDKAREALIKTKGDLAEAILLLTEGGVD